MIKFANLIGIGTTSIPMPMSHGDAQIEAKHPYAYFGLVCD
ncbi:hypothetical protein [Novosphingobium sp. ERN07]|nr:hypothetical protein [Novosphingobium sp. ERN07]